MFDDDDGFGFDDAMMLGTGYALLRHGQDRQTHEVIQGILAGLDMTQPDPDPEPEEYYEPINALDYTAETLPQLEDYIGQEPLKNQILTYIKSAQVQHAALPHVLLASGYPGVGKTTMARLIAEIMGVKIIELVPPFKSIETIVDAAKQLGNKDILFIDEIHKLTDGVGARGAEVLLKILEDKVAFLPTGQVIRLADITIIGATTDRDKLPETIVDRFKIKPYFQAYDMGELGRIAIRFAFRHRAEDLVDDDLAFAIAYACRGTPRIIEEMIMAAKAMALSSGTPPTPEELLEFLEVEPDGLTRTHIHYLTALRQYYGRETKDGGVEFIVGEAAMMQILRETKQGIGRIERFLVERGLIDRTPRGRRLTPAGIERAEAFILAGKGVTDVA
jgi:Holliday junction DNA helicase RuvB